MTNAFTAKPDTSWLKKAELSRRASVNSSKALDTPTAKQRIQLTPKQKWTKPAPGDGNAR